MYLGASERISARFSGVFADFRRYFLSPPGILRQDRNTCVFGRTRWCCGLMDEPYPTRLLPTSLGTHLMNGRTKVATLPSQLTPAEEFANFVTHGVGLVLSLAGVAVMAAVLRHVDSWRLAGCSIY